VLHGTAGAIGAPVNQAGPAIGTTAPFLAISRRGATRLVILIGGLAIKLPKVTGLARFGRGRDGNKIEARMWSQHREELPELCPVLWCAPLGLALAMPRVQMMSDAEFWAWAESDEYPDHWRPAAPYEHKARDWGWLRGRPVVVDYAVDAH
jgi:hypothetical protein